MPTTSYISSYTTGDEINGTASIIPSIDVRVDAIQVVFIGEQSIQSAFATPNKASHRFLNIVQFVEGHSSPESCILRKSQTYSFEFTFHVSDILSPSSCFHNLTSPTIRAAHLRPPPSLGDATTSGFGGKLRDDFAPPTCQISYMIEVQLSRMNLLSGREEILLVKKEKLRIKPALNEWATLPPGLSRPDYCMRGKLPIYAKGKRMVVGQLSVTVDEPIYIWLPSRDPDLLISESFRVNLVYESGDSNPAPPELDSFESQIIATTFYTARLDEMYQPFEKRKFLGKPTNFHDKTFPPVVRPISASLHWSSSGTGVYTTTLQMPVSLPRENFIPTFHSCLISRIYAPKCRLNIKMSRSIKLVLPMNISVKPDPAVLPSYNASVAFSK